MTDFSEFHVVIVDGHPDDVDVSVLHPTACPVWVGTSPNWQGETVRYECGITWEIDNTGFDSMFPDGLEPGIWRVRSWHEVIPGNPNWGSGFSEHDAGVEVERLELADNDAY